MILKLAIFFFTLFMIDTTHAETMTRPILQNDLDEDGWADDQSNLEYSLILQSIEVIDKRDSGTGHDKLYLLADGVRFPQEENLTGIWKLKTDEKIKNQNIIVARRFQSGTEPYPLKPVTLSFFDAHLLLPFDWQGDSFLFQRKIFLDQYENSDLIKVYQRGGKWPHEFEYIFTFKISIHPFADPSPNTAHADQEKDGFDETEEFELAEEFGGVSGPLYQDIWVEVDTVQGYDLKERAYHLIKSQFFRHNLNLNMILGGRIPEDKCISDADLNEFWTQYYDHNLYPGFHYAVIAGKLFNKRTGMSHYDTFIIAGHVWWMKLRAISQAGTFMHELGHQLGLLNENFWLIDNTKGDKYKSVMNYKYQAWIVDFSEGKNDSNGIEDFNDWDNLDLTYTQNFDLDHYPESYFESGICDE